MRAISGVVQASVFGDGTPSSGVKISELMSDLRWFQSTGLGVHLHTSLTCVLMSSATDPRICSLWKSIAAIWAKSISFLSRLHSRLTCLARLSYSHSQLVSRASPQTYMSNVVLDLGPSGSTVRVYNFTNDDFIGRALPLGIVMYALKCCVHGCMCSSGWRRSSSTQIGRFQVILYGKVRVAGLFFLLVVSIISCDSA